jgi:hypothetical protein
MSGLPNESNQLLTLGEGEVAEAPGDHQRHDDQSGEHCESQSHTNAAHAALAHLIPNIPGIAMRPPPAIFFIIFCISRN